MPEGIDADTYSELLNATLSQLRKGDVRLLLDPASERPSMLLEPRLTVASDLLRLHMPQLAVLVPDTLHRAPAHRKALAHLAGPNAVFARRHDPAAQILTQGSHGTLLSVKSGSSSTYTAI